MLRSTFLVILVALSFILPVTYAGDSGSGPTSAHQNDRKHNKHRKKHRRMKICHQKRNGEYRLMNLKVRAALRFLERYDNDRLPNDDGTCEFEPAEDWGTCPCIDGGPWGEVFGFPNSDTIESVILGVAPWFPGEAYFAYDADGNQLGSLFLYGSAGASNPFFNCAAKLGPGPINGPIPTYFDDSFPDGEVDAVVELLDDCRNGLQPYCVNEADCPYTDFD